MADGVKISQLPQLLSADVDDTDELVIVDVSEGVSKKITRSKLLGSAFPTVDINGGTIDGTVIGGTTPAAITGTTITGTTITGTSFVSSGNMTFGDNDKALFGAGSDLEIYHDGSNSYIADTGVGYLIISSGTDLILRSAGGENYIHAVGNAGVTSYYDGVAKLATTSTGITVTGTATASGGFTGDLTGNVTGNLTGNVTSTGSSTFSSLDVTTLSIGSTAITATAAELNYVDGVTSNIQTQLDTKLSSISSQSIKDLSDVYSLMAPSDGQILVWDSVNSRWQAEDNTGGGGGGSATLSGVLANGNTTGGYDINVNSGSLITFGDNNKAVFGVGSDLEIYSDGTIGQLVGTINITGNVGINDSSPSHVLDVQGDSTSQAAVAKITRNQASAFNNTYTFEVDSSAHTSNLSVAGAMAVDVSGGRAFTITGQGRAGIGESTPVTDLHITNTGSVQLLLESGNTSTSFLLFGDTDDSNVGAINYNHSDDSMLFKTNDSESMRITSTGNVGIGTDSPIGLLETYDTGTAMILSTTTTGLSGFRARSTSGNFYFSIDDSTGSGFSTGAYSRVIWSDNGYPIVFSTNSAQRMRIAGDGNVGIGTTDPDTKLHIVAGSNSATDYPLTIQNSADSLNTGYGAYGISQPAGSSFTLDINSDLILSPGGNVGIGDTAPSEKLNVAGNIMLEGSDAYVYLTNVGTGNSGIYVRGNTAGSYLRSHSTGKFTWEVTGTQVISVDGDGLKFNNDSASANALNDYEEGTFTATATGTSSLGNTTGYYTKIGNTVYFTWYSQVATMNAAVNAVIGGLPYTCISPANGFTAVYTAHNNYAPNSTGGYVIANAKNIYLTNDGNITQATTASSGSKYIMIAGTYLTYS